METISMKKDKFDIYLDDKLFCENIETPIVSTYNIKCGNK